MKPEAHPIALTWVGSSYRKVYDMSNLWYTGNEMNYELECMGLVTFEQKCSYFITILIEKIRKILKNN